MSDLVRHSAEVPGPADPPPNTKACVRPVERTSMAPSEIVGQWDVHEITLAGPSDGNPFLDVEVRAEYTCGAVSVQVAGFYDGDGVYRIRFMPHIQGEWRYATTS